MWIVILPKGTYSAMFSKCDEPFKVTLYGIIQKTIFLLKILWERFHNLRSYITKILLYVLKFCAVSWWKFLMLRIMCVFEII